MQHPTTFKLAVSLKTMLARLMLGLFILGAGALLLMSLKQEGFSDSLRAQAERWIAPITSLFSTPVKISKSGIENVDHYVSVRDDNARLRKENQALLLWQQRAATLEEDNQALRALTNASELVALPYTTALVTAMDGGPYREAVKLNRGTQSGVAEGMAVVNEAGFVGRIIEARAETSWMLLLHDVNSRIPVRNARNNERAILLGGRGQTLRLSFLSKEADFQTGDAIVTAADGKVLPDGLPVGNVGAINESPILEPLMVSSQLRYVHILGAENERVSSAPPAVSEQGERAP